MSYYLFIFLLYLLLILIAFIARICIIKPKNQFKKKSNNIYIERQRERQRESIILGRCLSLIIIALNDHRY